MRDTLLSIIRMLATTMERLSRLLVTDAPSPKCPSVFKVGPVKERKVIRANSD